MEMGCKSLPYTPHVFFVDEQGAAPGPGMAFDSEGGVTVLVILEADPSYTFAGDEVVQWAAFMGAEYEAKRPNKTFSELKYEFFTSSLPSKAPDCEEAWCFLRTGNFSSRGASPAVRHADLLATWSATRSCRCSVLGEHV